MSIIRPFRALRPVPERVAAVAAVPYDVVNRQEASALAEGNPWSFLHISRPEIDLPESENPYSDETYRMAVSNFQRLVRECPLVQEDAPALYLYQLKQGSHEQTGIAGVFSLDEYSSGTIKKHERTRKDKEDDRTRHIRELSAQTGPAFLAYKAVVALDQAVAHEKKNSKPLYDFVAADGVSHTLWRIADPSSFIRLFETQVKSLYIADGHHRAAAASRVYAESSNRSESTGFFYAVAFPDNQLRVLPYHRVVKDLGGMSSSDFLEQLAASFEIERGDPSIPAAKEFGMYLGTEGWFRLKVKHSVLKTRTGKDLLDVSLLQDLLLEPVLGIRDPRTDKRIDFVGGSRGVQELVTLVDSRKFAVAFSMSPTLLSEVFEIADQGDVMPPKSTWFEPKLRDGLLSYLV